MITIRPGDNAEAVADQILATLNGVGADRAEKGLAAAMLAAAASNSAGGTKHGQPLPMAIGLFRAGSPVENATEQ
jgi:hypothetical protein